MTPPPTDQPPEGFDEHLHAAYTAAGYRVGNYTLHVGHPHPTFDAWLERERRTHYVILTAFNPLSVELSTLENAARHRTLLSLLRVRGYSFVEAVGTDPEVRWPAEEGVCLFDLPPGEAHALGRIYEQHAIVEGKRGGVPLLVYLS